LYDVVIVGAGPAGATAAALLAKQDRSVLLVERDSLPHRSTQMVWVSKQARPLLKTVGAKSEAALGCPFTDLTFYNADLTKTAKPDLAQAPGYLVDRAAFDYALVQAAVAAGAELREQWPVAEVRLCEGYVEVKSEAHATADAPRGRMLLAAVGYGGDLAHRLHRSGHSPPPPPAVWTAQVETTLTESPKRKPKAKPAASVSVVLGLDRGAAFGLVMLTAKRLAIAISAGSPEEVAGLFPELCQRLAAAAVIPVDLSGEAAQAQAQPSPAGLALEMDSHVAKHALQIGEAGGFVSAASNESIYPAMWSARLAAEVVLEALDGEHSQDVLMTFDSRWRMSMAEYLRPPGTDIQFLLPLIFSNQPMADRMGAAFFAGKNI
jgi:flavin-dependent dehydrogenase